MLLDIPTTTETIKAVGDYGMAVVSAALYLCISGGLMWFCVKWFKTLISDIIKQQQENSREMIQEIKKQGELIGSIAERLQSETLLRLNVMFDFCFGYLTEQLCGILEQVITENHLDDKQATERKVNLLVNNVIYQVKQGLSYFSWKGRHIDKFFSDDWTMYLVDLLLTEAYETEHEKSRYHSLFENNIKNIKNELLKRITDGL